MVEMQVRNSQRYQNESKILWMSEIHSERRIQHNKNNQTVFAAVQTV